MLILCLFKFMNMNNLQSGLFFSLTGITAVASLSSCASQKKTEEQKPYNIVYIMTDDHTAQMMSCYDKRYMETPNLDRIANDGVRFTNSFVANSLSGPSRACMITGKHSCANKFYDNTTSVSYTHLEMHYVYGENLDKYKKDPTNPEYYRVLSYKKWQKEAYSSAFSQVYSASVIGGSVSYTHLIQNVLHPFRLFTDALDQRIIFVVGGKFIH